MTLPRPYEVEKGELSPRENAAPERIDLDRLLAKLIVSDEAYLDIAGCRLSVPGGQSAEHAAERFRRAIADRFLERRPNADEATWQRFANALQASLSDETEANESVLSQALMLIDGL